MARFNTVTKRVVTAAPDVDGAVLARSVTSAAVRPYLAGRGTVGYDRGDPAHTFNGAVPVAPSPAAAVSRVAASPATVPYMPPAFQDAAIPDGALKNLAVIQWNRLNRK